MVLLGTPRKFRAAAPAARSPFGRSSQLHREVQGQAVSDAQFDVAPDRRLESGGRHGHQYWPLTGGDE
jgi:hypothetical protein